MTEGKALTREEARALTDEVKRDLGLPDTGLAPAERDRLTVLEVEIERGLENVGRSLAEIRDSRLYRETHETFKDYCLDRWAMSHRHANRQIQAAKVIAEVGPMGPEPNERQARELAPLLDRPDELREAWAEASSNGAPTAQAVRQAVAPRIGIPLDETLLAQQQRENLIASIDRALRSFEASESTARAECQRLLRDGQGDPGPFTPSRFERAAEFARAFASELREAGIDG